MSSDAEITDAVDAEEEEQSIGDLDDDEGLLEDSYELDSEDDGVDFDSENFEPESDDEMGDAFAHIDDTDGGGLKRTVSYQVLTADTINDTTSAMIHDVMSVCAVPSEAATSLMLRHFEWNKERLIEAMMEKREETLADIGLKDNFALDASAHAPGSEEFECLICDEVVPMSQTFALGCGHRFCSDCYRGHLETTIKDGARCVYGHCPAPDCEVIVHEDAYRKLVSPEQFERYSLFLKRSFVDDNPNVKWCPFPGCTSAIRADRANRLQPVDCSTCGNAFCFRCADAEKGDHNPVSCEALDAWLAKGEDESENVKWMIANTKKCPKCRSPIEKNGGCMHMTCQTAGCRYDFCWMCRGPWSEHGSATGGYYSCNKYDESSAKEEDQAADSVKTELEYYMFYFHRYESHKTGLKDTLAKTKVLPQLQSTLTEKFEVRMQDAAFLADAFDQLRKNKRALMYSYVMGYSLDRKSSNKTLFEYLQEDLEKYTNALSDMCDRRPDEIEDYNAFMKWKEEVANYTRVTSKYLAGFVEGALENDWR